jgi:hypothetical protein
MSVTDTPFKRHSRAQGIALIDAARSRPSASLAINSPPPALSREGTLRRSRVLNARQTPSWVQSRGAKGESPRGGTPDIAPKQAERPPPPPRQVDTIVLPKSNWVEHVKLGTLVQGGRESLVCCSRKDQRLFMLKDIGRERDSHVDTIATLQHRHVALASFHIDTESTSYIAFQYTRHTLEELLHIHVTMDECHIRAIALPVRSADRGECRQAV